jgi:phytoene/squalene synthetase
VRAPALFQHRLDEVSRSFAMCIPQLDPPFRDHVALAYLLFRVVDTIEDAPFTDKPLQQRQFERIRRFLRALPSRTEVDAFAAAFPEQITPAERAVVGDTRALLESGFALPGPARVAMFGAIDRMARGMAAYTRRPSPMRLVDLEDVARYCCFVAGLVGEMLTQLWALEHVGPAPTMLDAYHFGLFLQKVNILKDERDDVAAGRLLVPDRQELLASLRDDARGALAYLRALPTDERGYRTFCAWALMMGATTISNLDLPKQSRRTETAALLARTAAIVDDNAALARLLDELMPSLPEPVDRAPVAKPEGLDWFRATLAAPLTDHELRRLGIGSLIQTSEVRTRHR